MARKKKLTRQNAINNALYLGLEKTIQWYLDNPEILNDISQTVLDPSPWKVN